MRTQALLFEFSYVTCNSIKLFYHLVDYIFSIYNLKFVPFYDFHPIPLQPKTQLW